MAKAYNRLGLMIDMSRNAVMTKEALSRFLPLIKGMGYNSLMLYTEDTYEVEGEEYFGYMRGRYSIAEMKEIKAMANGLGIELIPCIQTLAHLNEALKWDTIPVDCHDIMMADDERTYEVIDRMISTLEKVYGGGYIHIGMDEAHMLGRGIHLDRFGYETQNAIIKRHLNRVTEICHNHGFKPMLWSDMFFRSWNRNNTPYGEYYLPKVKMPEEVVASLPEGVIPVYWDYYHDTEEDYDNMIYNHKQLSDEVWFAGGNWCWGGFTPYNAYTIKTMLPAIRSCRKNKIKNIFFTLWGDDGAECSHFSQLPSLYYVAQYAKGITDEAKIKEGFKRRYGVDYDEFCLLDLPNFCDTRTDGVTPKNPAKYMLYSDYLNGFLDVTVEEGIGKRYAELAEKLEAVKAKTRKYGYLFDTAAKLCRVHELKYELGVKTRAAYLSGDRDELRRLATEVYPEVERRLRVFGRAFEKQWFLENKACGFDVQDIRLGAIIQRTDATRRRLLSYLKGEIDSIPELEEKLLPYADNQPVVHGRYVRYATTNNFSWGV